MAFKIHVKTPAEYWKNYFNQTAKQTTSDYVLNRGTNIVLPRHEAQSRRQFLEAIDPKPSDVVLDAGCGSGRNISLLSGLVREIVGLDFAEEMIERARQKVAEEKLANVKLLVGNVTSLPFPDDTFDKLICTSVLQYLDDAACEAAIREFIRVCKDGATIVMHVKNSTSLYGLSLRLHRFISPLLGRKIATDYYRSRAWHERAVQRSGGDLTDFDGFEIFNFIPMPRWCVRPLVAVETRVLKGRFLKKYGVNFKMTVKVANKGPGKQPSAAEGCG